MNNHLNEMELIINKMEKCINENQIEEIKKDFNLLKMKFDNFKGYFFESNQVNINTKDKKKYQLDNSTIERLWQELKRIRFKIARENCVPAWKIFNDKLLDEYLRILPINKKTFMKTSFYSEARYQLYGKEISKLIADFIMFENNNEFNPLEGFDNILDKAIFCGERKIYENNDEVKSYGNSRKNNTGTIIAKQGSIYSEKMKKEIIFDSELERKFIMILEKSSKVKYFCAQPFEIRYGISYKFNEEDSYNHKRYYPDFLVVLNDGTRILVEMKNYLHLTDIRSKMKYELIKKISKKYGMGYIISTNGKHTLEEAIEYKIDPEFENEIVKRIEAEKSITYREFVNIRNKFKVKNQSILPLAYKYNFFMFNNTISSFKIHFIEDEKIYVKRVF